jgi:nucleotide-binding universal stress UspA family protein
MTRILVCLDGSKYSKTISDYAFEMGRLLGSSVSALYVIETKALEGFYSDAHFQASEGSLSRENYRNKLLDILTKRGEQVMDDLESKFSKLGMKVERIIAEGNLSSEILSRSMNFDMVIMGRRGEHAAWGGPLMGSTAENIVHSIRVPLFLGVEQFRPIKRVLFAYDGTKYITKALDWLKEPLGREKVSLSILTVGPLPRPAVELVDEATVLLENYPGDITTWSEEGDCAERILDVADHDNVDLIVLGAYGYTRVRELILGSVTAEVLRRSKQAVLCYR